MSWVSEERTVFGDSAFLSRRFFRSVWSLVEVECTDSLRVLMAHTLSSDGSSLACCSTVMLRALSFLAFTGAWSSSSFCMLAFTLAKDKFCRLRGWLPSRVLLFAFRLNWSLKTRSCGFSSTFLISDWLLSAYFLDSSLLSFLSSGSMVCLLFGTMFFRLSRMPSFEVSMTLLLILPIRSWFYAVWYCE